MTIWFLVRNALLSLVVTGWLLLMHLTHVAMLWHKVCGLASMSDPILSAVSPSSDICLLSCGSFWICYGYKDVQRTVTCADIPMTCFIDSDSFLVCHDFHKSKQIQQYLNRKRKNHPSLSHLRFSWQSADTDPREWISLAAAT